MRPASASCKICVNPRTGWSRTSLSHAFTHDAGQASRPQFRAARRDRPLDTVVLTAAAYRWTIGSRERRTWLSQARECVMIRFSCPQCRNGFQVDDKAAGKQTKCPKCGAAMVVPAASQVPPDLPRPATCGVDEAKQPAVATATAAATAPVAPKGSPWLLLGAGAAGLVAIAVGVTLWATSGGSKSDRSGDNGKAVATNNGSATQPQEPQRDGARPSPTILPPIPAPAPGMSGPMGPAPGMAAAPGSPAAGAPMTGFAPGTGAAPATMPGLATPMPAAVPTVVPARRQHPLRCRRSPS